MQYLKDAMKKNLEEAALNEFKQNGYNNTSIREIAKKAATSVGNFYKYFSSKDDLYEQLIGTVYFKLMDYINRFSEVEFNEKTDDIFYKLMEKIMEIFKDNSTQLAILLNKSEGSKYENCKVVFTDFVTRIVSEKMEYELSLDNKKLSDNFIISLISFNLVESVAIILREKEDGVEVRKLILDMIEILYKDISNKIDFKNI